MGDKDDKGERFVVDGRVVGVGGGLTVLALAAALVLRVAGFPAAASAEPPRMSRIEGVERAFVVGPATLLLYRRSGEDLVPYEIETEDGEPVRIVTDAPQGGPMYLVAIDVEKFPRTNWAWYHRARHASLHVHAGGDLDGGSTVGKGARSLHAIERPEGAEGRAGWTGAPVAWPRRGVGSGGRTVAVV